VAGRSTTDRAEPKLALENAAEKKLEPAALQLTKIFCPFVFFRNEAIVADLLVQNFGHLADLLQTEIFSWYRQYGIERFLRRSGRQNVRR